MSSMCRSATRENTRYLPTGFSSTTATPVSRDRRSAALISNGATSQFLSSASQSSIQSIASPRSSNWARPFHSPIATRRTGADRERCWRRVRGRVGTPGRWCRSRTPPDQGVPSAQRTIRPRSGTPGASPPARRWRLRGQRDVGRREALRVAPCSRSFRRRCRRRPRTGRDSMPCSDLDSHPFRDRNWYRHAPLYLKRHFPPIDESQRDVVAAHEHGVLPWPRPALLPPDPSGRDDDERGKRQRADDRCRGDRARPTWR